MEREDTLAGVSAAAVDLIRGVDCADVLLIHDGDFRSIAATSALAPLLDQAQRQTGEGPCPDASATAVMIRCDDLREDPRWPGFARAAVAAGVLSVLSFQLYTHGADSGALNLFGFGTGTFDDESEVIGAMLATHAAVALIAANRQHQFESALASRDIIGQAKGILMERYDVDAVRAFELLDMTGCLSRAEPAGLVSMMNRLAGCRLWINGWADAVANASPEVTACCETTSAQGYDSGSYADQRHPASQRSSDDRMANDQTSGKVAWETTSCCPVLIYSTSPAHYPRWASAGQRGCRRVRRCWL